MPEHAAGQRDSGWLQGWDANGADPDKPGNEGKLIVVALSCSESVTPTGLSSVVASFLEGRNANRVIRELFGHSKHSWDL